MEQRRLLAVGVLPIQIGAVYYEDNSGFDEAGDLIEITFDGGVDGTRLTELTIETDKESNGLTNGDVFFDIDPNGHGTFGALPLSILDQAGIDSVTPSVADGGTTLVFTFTGFDPGERLLFTIDVDEQGFLASSATAEGNEFEGSQLTAVFEAPHYYEAAGTDIFLDYYDQKLADSALALPPDDYVPPGLIPSPIQTAAAIFPITQRPLPITISGTVFEDVDLDNVQDAGEPGIAGVELALFELEGADYVATGQTAGTNAQGDYLFEDVLPGTYRVVEAQPDGYYSIGATAGTVDGVQRGVVLGDDVISDVQLVGGEDSVHNDFAEARPAALSGNVYHDADNDGVLDPGEPGIGEVIILIQYVPAAGPAPAPIEVTTSADGSWASGPLMPGDWRVEEVQPGGYLDGLDAAGSAGGVAINPGDAIEAIHLDSGQSGRQYNFGELLPSSISGRVVVDANGNGAYDPGETRLPGVTVHLRGPLGELLDTTQTDADGEYSFTGLPPGVYGVEEIQPEGYYDGADNVGSAGGSLLPPDAIVDVTLVSGTDAVRYDFLELEPASLSGFVYVDANNDGVRNFGEAPIAGVELTLLDADGLPTGVTTTTDAAGFYRFGDLVPDRQYGVAEAQPEGFFDGRDAPGTAGGVAHNPGDSITGALLGPGMGAKNYNFGELEPASLSGFVYVDANNNGARNFGEAPIAGVDLTLLGADGRPTGVTTTTDAAGFYRFGDLVPDRQYGVAETQPGGFLDGLDAPGTAGGIAHNPGDSITGALLAPGMGAKNYNFGELEPASIAGRVYADLNDNCAYDPGEPLLAGVTVYLLNASGARIASTTTDSGGEYLFDNLRPGGYGVEEIQPEGYFDGPEQIGSVGGSLDGNDRMVDVELVSGTDAVEYNFCELVPASISGYVFQDGPEIQVGFGQQAPDPATVRDGRFTPDDVPIAGVVLTLGDASGAPLLDGTGRPITAVTNADGYYEFTGLEPGVYTVLETHPEDYTDSIDTPGSRGGIAVNPHEHIDPMILAQLAVDPMNDAILRIPLGSGDRAESYNFSEVAINRMPPIIPPPPPPPPAPPPVTEPPVVESPPPVYRYLPAPERKILLPLYGGGGINPGAYTWHLSVINGGRPRRDSDGTDRVAGSQDGYFNPVSWSGAAVDQSLWILADGEGRPQKQHRFGVAGGTPVTGDFDGDGCTEVGVFLDGLWFLDLNGNGIWDEGDLWARLGDAGDLPVTGDWDGDGKTDIGIFGPAWAGDDRAIAAEPGLPDADNVSTGRYKNLPPNPSGAPVGWRTMKRTSAGRLRADVIDHVFQYGSEGDVAVAGDWNGDGVTNIGLFRRGSWYLDTDGNGRWSPTDVYVERFGQPGDVPVVGDFNGDGVDDLGVWRDGTWHLDSDGDRALSARDKVFQLGGPGDKPVVGDFNGDGIDEPAVYRDAATPAEQEAAQTPDPGTTDVAASQ